MDVLFVCTGNSGLSQMAEAMLKAQAGHRAQVFSAGLEPRSAPHRLARALLTERGLDPTRHHPHHVHDFLYRQFDIVVTIGERADAATPQFGAGVRRIHWPIRDPAQADGTPESEAAFRSALRQIADHLPDLHRLMDSLPHCELPAGAPAVSTVITRPARFEPAVHLPLFAACGIRAIELGIYPESGSSFPLDDQVATACVKRISDDVGITIVSLHVMPRTGDGCMTIPVAARSRSSNAPWISRRSWEPLPSAATAGGRCQPTILASMPWRSWIGRWMNSVTM